MDPPASAIFARFLISNERAPGHTGKSGVSTWVRSTMVRPDGAADAVGCTAPATTVAPSAVVPSAANIDRRLTFLPSRPIDS